MKDDYLKPQKVGRKPKNYIEPNEIRTNSSSHLLHSNLNKKKKKKIKHENRGRPRINFDFHTARLLIRNECLESKSQYCKWWEANKPARIPKRPDRAYKKEFISWNDFLGNNNTPFPIKHKVYKRFVDARSFIRSLKLKNQDEFFDYIRSDDAPADIPRRPDIVYRETRHPDDKETDIWFSWDDWLGKSIIDKLEERKKDIRFMVIYKTDENIFPENIYNIEEIRCSTSLLKDVIKKKRNDVINIYILEDDSNIKQYLNKKYKSTEYPLPDNHYYIFNINELLYTLDIMLKSVDF